jgi:DNA polymerase-3 subunit delta
LKASRAEIDRALKAPAEHLFFLFHGPDTACSQALAAALGKAMGPEAERTDFSGSELKADPARLAAEAASISLFGGARYIIVEPAGEEVVPALEALIEAPAAGNPVALIAGALRPSSGLLKLALAHRSGLALANYLPEGANLGRLAMEMAREHGLTLRPDLAQRIAEAAGGNRAVIARELEKFATLIDAAPERPRELDDQVVDLVGAASEGGDLSRLVDAVSGGDAALLQTELLRLAGEGIEGIPLIRAVLRRMQLLARLRGEVERGSSPSAVMASQGKALFWKEKDAVGSQLARWRSELLARSLGRLLEAERQLKSSGSLGTAMVDEELFAICRQAERLR